MYLTSTNYPLSAGFNLQLLAFLTKNDIKIPKFIPPHQKKYTFLHRFYPQVSVPHGVTL